MIHDQALTIRYEKQDQQVHVQVQDHRRRWTGLEVAVA